MARTKYAAMKIKITEPERATEIAEPLLALIRSAFEEQRGAVDPESSALDLTQAELENMIEGENLAIASVGREMAGSVFFTADGNDLYLHTLAVSPDHRRRGVGRALIDHVVACAHEGGYRRVTLNMRTNLDKNFRMFQRLGFSKFDDGYHRGYNNPTYLKMAKQLAV